MHHIFLREPVNKENGKATIIVLIVSAIITWQTLRIIDIGVRERKLLNSRTISVQMRQSVLSLSSKTLKFITNVNNKALIYKAFNGDTISFCLTKLGRLKLGLCNSEYIDEVIVSGKLTNEVNPPWHEAGNNWQYLKLTSMANKSGGLEVKETIQIALEINTQRAFLQQRFWVY